MHEKCHRETSTLKRKVHTRKTNAFRRASHRHQTLASNPALFTRHLSTCTCSLVDFRCNHLEKPLMQSGFKQPIDLLHPTSPTSPSYLDSRQLRLSSRSRRGSSALPVIIRQSSAVRTHIAVARAVECLRVGDQIRDLPVVIRVFAQDCAQMHVQMIPRGSHRVVNDSHPPFSIQTLL